MWRRNNKLKDDDEESWEVRAFEEDTTRGNLMGCTWPPPSYSCTFCWREFRSAQALGGHMNVHRRDRAKRLEPPATNNSELLIPNRNLDMGNGLCLIYTIPNPNPISVPFPTSPGLTMEQLHTMAAHGGIVFPAINSNSDIQYDDDMSVNDPSIEEVDLELRLGRKSPPPGKWEDNSNYAK